jgi:hypothetical protein
MMVGYFAENYVAARSQFLSACHAAKCELKSYTNDQGETPDSGKLITDTARFGPEHAERVLVLVSGTHGVEGYCGSACQIAAIALGLFDDLPSNQALLMVHAINPYGFALSRRITEDNVDLNRNCVAEFRTPELEKFNPDYDILDSLLNPIEWQIERPHVGFDKIVQYIKDWGLKRFQQAVSVGQYRHRSGLFYGGSERSWSRQTLETIISNELVGTNNVTVVDYHTGLGRPGHGEIISVDEQTSEGYKRATRLYGEGVKSTKPAKSQSEQAGESVSADVHGSIDALFNNKERTLTYVALEFGTVEVLEVLEALRADNWCYQQRVRDSSLTKIIASEMRAAFYPNSEVWRQAVLHRSAQLLTKAWAALGALEG